MIYRAYGKINLSLNITGIREDGYHTLESIFLPIDFYDQIKMEKSENMEYSANKSYLRFNETNTIVKAVELMKSEYNIQDNFKIHLDKSIPTQAGLAGGSADGAAIIRIFNKMYHLHPSFIKVQELCSRIGSDVLFTYYAKPALVSGIGEKIEFIDVKKDYYVLLIKPRFGVSTKECYNLMNLETCFHPDIQKLKVALENGEDYIPYLGNSLEDAAISLVSDIQNAKKDLLEAGAPFALMSGSGSTVFTMSEDENLIIYLKEKLKNKKYFVRYAKVLKMI